jgi:hypothetical protein
MQCSCIANIARKQGLNWVIDRGQYGLVASSLLPQMENSLRFYPKIMYQEGGFSSLPVYSLKTNLAAVATLPYHARGIGGRLQACLGVQGVQ